MVFPCHLKFCDLFLIISEHCLRRYFEYDSVQYPVPRFRIYYKTMVLLGFMARVSIRLAKEVYGESYNRRVNILLRGVGTSRGRCTNLKIHLQYACLRPSFEFIPRHPFCVGFPINALY